MNWLKLPSGEYLNMDHVVRVVWRTWNAPSATVWTTNGMTFKTESHADARCIEAWLDTHASLEMATPACTIVPTFETALEREDREAQWADENPHDEPMP